MISHKTVHTIAVATLAKSNREAWTAILVELHAAGVSRSRKIAAGEQV